MIFILVSAGFLCVAIAFWIQISWNWSQHRINAMDFEAMKKLRERVKNLEMEKK